MGVYGAIQKEKPMNIRTSIRTLAAAALLALTVASVSAGPAHAEKKGPADNGVRCDIAGSLVGSDNDMEFYLPGDSLVVDVGTGPKAYVCGNDGHWHYRRATPGGVRPVEPLSGGVLAP